MTAIFADASYWIAILNAHDQWHDQAHRAEARLGASRLVTTEEVLAEILDGFSDWGIAWRHGITRFVDRIRSDPGVLVVHQSHESFEGALHLYRNRLDKGYSLTDCRSFLVMREMGIDEALTADRHFQQEGFTLLLTRGG